jgi:radical SAM family protein
VLPIIGQGSGPEIEAMADLGRPGSSAQPFRIYQVELTSHCNMKCSYCPHPVMKRKQGVMSAEVLGACIRRVQRQGAYCLVLHHFGDPLLHPELRSRLLQVADAGLPILFSTNALLLDEHWDMLAAMTATVYIKISVHQWARRPESEYFEALKTWRVRAKGTNIRIADAGNFDQGKYYFHNWTDGTDEPWDASSCLFIRHNLGVVLWNGDIATCCADHEGETARLNILDPNCDDRVAELWSACVTCDVGRKLKTLPWEADALSQLTAETPGGAGPGDD